MVTHTRLVLIGSISELHLRLFIFFLLFFAQHNMSFLGVHRELVSLVNSTWVHWANCTWDFSEQMPHVWVNLNYLVMISIVVYLHLVALWNYFFDRSLDFRASRSMLVHLLNLGILVSSRWISPTLLLVMFLLLDSHALAWIPCCVLSLLLTYKDRTIILSLQVGFLIHSISQLSNNVRPRALPLCLGSLLELRLMSLLR